MLLLGSNPGVHYAGLLDASTPLTSEKAKQESTSVFFDMSTEFTSDRLVQFTTESVLTSVAAELTTGMPCFLLMLNILVL